MPASKKSKSVKTKATRHKKKASQKRISHTAANSDFVSFRTDKGEEVKFRALKKGTVAKLPHPSMKARAAAMKAYIGASDANKRAYAKFMKKARKAKKDAKAKAKKDGKKFKHSPLKMPAKMKKDIARYAAAYSRGPHAKAAGSKIKNPRTGRMITVGGAVWKSLVESKAIIM